MNVMGLFCPLFIYLGLKVFSSRLVALLMGMALVGNFLVQNRRVNHMCLLIPFSIILLIYLAVALLNSSIIIIYLPFLISASFLISFSYSLLYPPNAIEVFASMLVQDLSTEEIAYCRRITLIWVLFFMLNGMMAFYTACCTSFGIWSLYNGLIAYVVMGILFVVELSYRSWRFRRYPGLPTDFIFKKLFPPKA